MRFQKFIAITLTMACLVACQSTAAGNPTATPNAEMTPAVTRSEPMIESLQLTMLETFPVQVNLHIKGYLPDSCTTIDRINVKRNESIFTVKVITKRDPEVVCTQKLQPFEESQPLEVEGLPAGTYRVVIGDDHAAIFTLDSDNERPESNDAGG